MASGAMSRRGMKLLDRFHANVDKEGGDEACWEWRGSRSGTGYGQIKAPGVRNPLAAHRLAYFLATCEEPPVVRHSCDNRGCVNPAHLLPGTMKDNYDDMVKRGRRAGKAESNARKTHCKHGHEFTPENTYRHSPTGGRKCRACTLNRAKAVG